MQPLEVKHIFPGLFSHLGEVLGIRLTEDSCQQQLRFQLLATSISCKQTHHGGQSVSGTEGTLPT